MKFQRDKNKQNQTSHAKIKDRATNFSHLGFEKFKKQTRSLNQLPILLSNTNVHTSSK